MLPKLFWKLRLLQTFKLSSEKALEKTTIFFMALPLLKQSDPEWVFAGGQKLKPSINDGLMTPLLPAKWKNCFDARNILVPFKDCATVPVKRKDEL